jgi:disulfide bond formation protein DsbB
MLYILEHCETGYYYYMPMSIKLKNLYKLIMVLSALALAFAYVIEYIGRFPVCPLCVYQRFPYLILILLSIISISEESQKNLIKYYRITVIAAILLAFYHTGVERGIFEMSGFCKPLVKISDNLSVSDFTKMLYNTETLGKCNKPALVIFGLSMTEWNLILNVLLFIILIRPEFFLSIVQVIKYKNSSKVT